MQKFNSNDHFGDISHQKFDANTSYYKMQTIGIYTFRQNLITAFGSVIHPSAFTLLDNS